MVAVWGFTYKTYTQKILVLPKKIIKVMTFNKQNAHTTHIFANLEFLKFNDIRQLQLLSFVYDCQNKLAPIYFHDYFVQCSQVHHYSTRLASRGDLFLERKNTFQYGVRSIEYNGARLWNMLPVVVRESSSPSVFRSDLQNIFCHNILAHKGGFRLVLGVGVIPAGCTAGIEGCRCVLGLVSTIQDLDRY